MSAKIIDFISHLQQKNDLKNIVNQGWDSDNFYFQKNKALNIYLVDKNRENFYFFNCDFDELNSITEAEQKHSRHFLHGWRLLTKPAIDYSFNHQKLFFKLTLNVIAGMDQWHSIPKKSIKNELADQSHMILLIDRQNLENPLELVLLQTYKTLLTPRQIKDRLSKFDHPKHEAFDENFLRIAWD